MATYFFSAASSLLLAVVITVVVETVLARRPEFARSAAEDIPTDATNTATPTAAHTATPGVRLAPEERRALTLSAGVFVLYVALLAVLVLIPGSPLLGKNGSMVNSVVVVNISVFIALLFALLGFVYGRSVGSVPSLSSVPSIMAEGVSRIAPVIVLFFAVSQFLAYFEWTGIGSVVTVHGADLLHSLNAPHLLVLFAILLAISLLNMIMTTGSAMWAILAPVLVPMMMYLSIRPEAAQVAFMIGDSVTNAVTPMSPYFVLALGFVQQYRKNAGIGTLMSFTIPISLSVLIVWSAFFAVWYGVGIPLGPGVPVR